MSRFLVLSISSLAIAVIAHLLIARGNQKEDKYDKSKTISKTNEAKKKKNIKAICVYCGSSIPKGEKGKIIMEKAAELGRELAKRKITLIYGGGSDGLMGAMAKACDEAGGKVKGIIPFAFFKGINKTEEYHIQRNNCEFVNSMHERKARMCALSDAFIAMPGGFGTLDELFEAATWTQLGVHRASVGILNVEGYYDQLLSFLKSSQEMGLISANAMGVLCVESDVAELLNALEEHESPPSFLSSHHWPSLPF